MNGTRCPECENDLTETMTATIVGQLQAGKVGAAPITCPHCGTELTVNASVTATLARQR